MHRRGAEDPEKRVLIKHYSELCELRVSVVNISSHETRQNQNEKTVTNRRTELR